MQTVAAIPSAVPASQSLEAIAVIAAAQWKETAKGIALGVGGIAKVMCLEIMDSNATAAPAAAVELFNVMVLVQVAIQDLAITANPAATAEHLTAQAHASTKVLAALAQHNALAQDISLAIQDASGKTAAQMQTEMEQTHSVGIPYVTITQILSMQTGNVILGKLNAAMENIRLATSALGKIPAQMPIVMQKTCNAAIPYATMQQEFMTQQRQ